MDRLVDKSFINFANPHYHSSHSLFFTLSLSLSVSANKHTLYFLPMLCLSLTEYFLDIFYLPCYLSVSLLLTILLSIPCHSSCPSLYFFLSLTHSLFLLLALSLSLSLSFVSLSPPLSLTEAHIQTYPRRFSPAYLRFWFHKTDFKPRVEVRLSTCNLRKKTSN